MDSRGNTYQFRSVPLIQRGDWRTLSDGSAVTGARDRALSSSATTRSTEPLREREERGVSTRRRDGRRRSRDDDTTRRRTRQRAEGCDRTRERDRTRDDRPRAERRRWPEPDDSWREETSCPREETPPLRASRATAPSRAPVSAYLDESTVVGVTPRSERRRGTYSSGFTVVPPVSEARAWPQYTPVASPGASAAYGAASDYGGSVDYGWGRSADVDIGWGDPSPFDDQPRRRARRNDVGTRDYDEERLPRRSRRPRDDGSVARDWLYTGEDATPRGTPGAARRREAVVGALTAVPRAALDGLVGLLAHTRGLFVLILALMTAFMLYAPARELYVANRRLETLQATYDALVEENDNIRGDLELLQSREGIENEARSRGYVAPGETKVIVEGLPEDESSDALDYLEPIELPDTRPWYTRILDELFNYHPEE